MTDRATRSRFAAAALLLTALWGCESADGVAGPGAARTDETLAAPAPSVAEVQEATFRHLIASSGASGFDAYCISTGENDADPSPELLAAFAGSQPPVVPLSDCTISVTGDTYNPTGGPAQWFFVRGVTFTGRVATVDAGWHINGRLAEFYRCTLHPGPQGSYVVRECELVGAA